MSAGALAAARLALGTRVRTEPIDLRLPTLARGALALALFGHKTSCLRMLQERDHRWPRRRVGPPPGGGPARAAPSPFYPVAPVFRDGRVPSGTPFTHPAAPSRQSRIGGGTLGGAKRSTSEAGGLAGRQGLEPRLTGPEPVVLPLNDLPVARGSADYSGRATLRQTRASEDELVARGGVSRRLDPSGAPAGPACDPARPSQNTRSHQRKSSTGGLQFRGHSRA
jgi:hypothetical protein